MRRSGLSSALTSWPLRRRGRAATALALALCLTGCGAAGPSGDRVQLITGVPPGMASGGCYTNFAVGPLIIDPTYGTAATDENGGGTTPVVWRPGFTGRRVGSEIVVRDSNGNVVAMTGRRYKIAGGYVGGGPDWPELPTRMFWACDFVIPQ
jgi:hypothetical protein